MQQIDIYSPLHLKQDCSTSFYSIDWMDKLDYLLVCMVGG
jgi:hypothetical protein